LREAEVLARDGDEFVPPQRPGIADQQAGAVAAGDEAPDLGGGQRRRLPRRGAVPADRLSAT
jgi:hypothetical protein